jgi:hypothetical protein
MRGKPVKLNSFIQTSKIYQTYIFKKRIITMELFQYETIKLYLQNIRNIKNTQTLLDVNQGNNLIN